MLTKVLTLFLMNDIFRNYKKHKKGVKMFLSRRNYGIYYLNYKDSNLKKIRKLSTRTKKKREAQIFMKQFADRVALENHIRIFKLSSLEKFVLDFNQINLSPATCGLYKRAFREFIKIIKNKLVYDVTPEKIEYFKSKRLKKVQPVTVNIELRCLKTSFNLAMKYNYVKTNPFVYVKQIKEVQKEKMVFTQEEIQRLLDVVDIPILKYFILIGIYTGMRLGEILNLEWNDILFEQRLIKILNKDNYTIKTGKVRTVPISDKLLIVLMEMKQICLEPTKSFLFQSYNGKPFDKSFITRKFKYFVKRAGLNESLHFHNLRHSFITELLRKEVSIYKVQKLAGHASVKTTEGYAHLVVDDLREAVELI